MTSPFPASRPSTASVSAAEAEAETRRLVDIMAQLRNPDGGCPWDVEQTFATIAPYTIEEAYEVADAIDRGDMDDLRDELGDLLLQVVFHARMAEEARQFDYGDVARAISDKMVRRHPHVFGDGSERTAETQTRAWEEQKAEEREDKGADSALDGVSVNLPALLRAEKLGKRAARVGFDWPDTGRVLDKVREEIDELEAEIDSGDAAAMAHEVGDLLFAVAQLARHLKIDPETALRDGNGRFERRFRHVEQALQADGKAPAEADLQTLERHWQTAKELEKTPPTGSST